MQLPLFNNTVVNKAVTGMLVCGAVAVFSSPVSAQESKAEIIAACEEAAQFLEDGDIDAALDEAEWCREGLLQMKHAQTLAVFPDEVGDYKGGEVTNENVLGMVTIGREYQNNGKSIDLQLISGGIPGLGSLGQLFNSLGSLAGIEGEKLRIQRRTVVNSSDDTQASLAVSLKSGGMLTVKSTTVSGEDAVEFLKTFPIKELDEALEK